MQCSFSSGARFISKRALVFVDGIWNGALVMKASCALFIFAAAWAWLGFSEETKPPLKPAAAPKNAPAQLTGITTLRDLPYVAGGHERQKLDLFVPEKGESLPLIVWIHGGGWSAGSKENCPALGFLRGGYAVASINYRLSQHAVYPAQIEDCKSAIRWLRAHAARYRINPDKIGVWGASAGGHLVALLGTTGDVKEFEKGEHLGQSSRVQAVCDWFGPTDFMEYYGYANNKLVAPMVQPDAPDSALARLVGGKLSEKKELVARANPITYASKGDAPFLIMHGDKDPLVPLHQSEILEQSLKKAGVPVTLYIEKGSGHSLRGPEVSRMMFAFFEKHLKTNGGPAAGR
jgi:acetyl esterase/lipase